MIEQQKAIFLFENCYEIFQKIKVDIVYAIIALHNFIIYHHSDDKEDIYNKDNLNDKALQDVNRNEDENN